MNKKFVFYAWLGAIGVLVAGLLLHRVPDEARLLPIWITEAGAFALLALFLYRPNNWTALGAFGGSVIWLLNQLSNWYGESLGIGGWLQNNIAGYTTVYVITAAAVCALIYFSVTKKGGSAPLVSTLGGAPKAGLLAFAVMGIFGVWKIWINYQLMAWTPPADFNSRVIWGLGIGIMGFATAWSLRGKEKKEAIYLVLIGLLLAASAALYYGRGLSLIT